MDVGAATLGVSFFAGVLSTLSPCVLPLLPILIGSALGSHRGGPLALASGLALSFTIGGVALASIGLYFGFDQGWLREGAAVLLLIFGVILLSSSLQARFTSLAERMGLSGLSLPPQLRLDSLHGQFALGLLLGLVWAPCVGPTLGAAVTLASQGKSLGQVTVVMAVFGFGAALPLALVGGLSRETLARARGTLLRVGVAGKYILGGLMVVLAVGILTGFDRHLEALLVAWSPDWLTELTTRF